VTGNADPPFLAYSRAPDELYKNGIQREQFVPCIDLIKDTFVVHCLDSDIGSSALSLLPFLIPLTVFSPTDYRKRPRELSKVYFSPITRSTRTEISKLFTASCASLTPGEDIVSSRSLSVWGRPVHVPLSTSKVAQFEFADLCGKPHSAADYLEITKTFGTIFLTDVPQLGLETKDQARRFILFVDAAYEARVRLLFALFSSLPPPLSSTPLLPSLTSLVSQTKLFVLSDPPIHAVFSDSEPKSGPTEITPHMRAMMDELGLAADVVGASSIFTGDEEVFAFARAVVRFSFLPSPSRSLLHFSGSLSLPDQCGK
jgi:protein AFG1